MGANRLEKASGLMINFTKTGSMWIGSLVLNGQASPWGLLLYTYDQKLLLEKNFIENLDKIKKLLNVCSSRVLHVSIYGKVTIIKSLVIPKFVYLASLLPTPNNVIVELNRLLYKFLWNGADKVTRSSTMNEFKKGGLRMIDLECMIKSLHLAWLKGISSKNEGTWKNYLRHLLASLGGLFFLTATLTSKITP